MKETLNCRKLIIICILLLFKVSHSYSRTLLNVEQKEKSNNQSDSLLVYPKKLSSEQAWEKIVNFPGALLFLPFHIIFIGIEETVEYIDETGILPKAVEYLSVIERPKGVYPKYSHRFGLGLAYYYKNLFNRGSTFDLSLQKGFKSRNRIRMRLRHLKLFGEGITSDIIIRYQFLSDESFFGIGNNSILSDESNFGYQQSTAEISINSHHFNKTKLGFRFGIDINSISKGRALLFLQQLICIVNSSFRVLKRNPR